MTPRRTMVSASALAAALLLSPGAGLAQPATRTPPAPPAPVEAPAPYEPQLLRLAEIMGSLAYLRDLCGPNDGATWRTRMATLLDAESASEARKERLAGAFNKGFRSFEATYRTCTPNANILIQRYLDEGGQIARDVGNRFGGG